MEFVVRLRDATLLYVRVVLCGDLHCSLMILVRLEILPSMKVAKALGTDSLVVCVLGVCGCPAHGFFGCSYRLGRCCRLYL